MTIWISSGDVLHGFALVGGTENDHLRAHVHSQFEALARARQLGLV